jgi:hypothetical protein
MRDLHFPEAVKNAADFFDREGEFVQIQRMLVSPVRKPITIVGERKIGKTSLLNVIADWLVQKPTHRVHFLPDTYTRDEFIAEMLQAICNATGDDLHQTGLLNSEGRFRLVTKGEFVQVAKRLTSQEPLSTFFFCIDEFDGMLSNWDDLTAKEISSLVFYLIEKTDLPIKFLFTMNQITKQIQRYYPSHFLSAGNIYRLKLWSDEQSRDFVEWLLEGRFVFTPEAFARLFCVAGGHPYFTKAILSALYERYETMPEGFSITPDDLAPAIDASLHSEEVGYILSNILEMHFSEEEKTLLREIFSNPQTNPRNSSIARNLVTRGYLDEQGTTYNLRLGILRHWLGEPSLFFPPSNALEDKVYMCDEERREFQTFAQEIAQEVARGEVVLFIGAGVSTGAGLPDWSKLMRPLAQKVNYKMPPDKFLTTEHLTAAAQHYETKYGRQGLIQYLREQLDTTIRQPTCALDAIAALPAQIIFTTNYDNLVELALHKAGKQYNLVVNDTDLPFVTNRGIQVIKLCGDLNQPSSIVITKQDFNTFSDTRPRLLETLRTTLEKKTALFLGYSLRDPFFNQVWDRIGLDMGAHRRFAYALLFDAELLEIEDLQRRGIRVFTLETRGRDKTALLTVFLRLIAGNYP